MNTLPLRIILVTALIVAQPALYAQNQNPITAAREAFKKAMEDAKRQAQGQAAPEPAQAGADQPAQPAPGATQSGTRSPAAAPGTASVRQTGDVPAAAASAQETARLAAALSYIDVAGVKLGAPLAEAQRVLAATNPKFRFRPLVETPWPLRGGQPPPNAPKSVNSLNAELNTGDGNGSESFDLSAAVHPNPPVVVKIFRSMNFPGNGGPSFDNLVASLRKKYGPESTANPTANPNPNDNSQRTFMGTWYFNERGQVLSGNLGAQLARTCVVSVQPINTGLCGTLTILEAYVGASGAGVVTALRVNAKSNPLEFSAHATTQAYLRQVEEGLARQQLQESSQRQVPKL